MYNFIRFHTFVQDHGTNRRFEQVLVLHNRTTVAMSSDEDDDDEYIIHGQLLDPIQEGESHNVNS